MRNAVISRSLFSAVILSFGLLAAIGSHTLSNYVRLGCLSRDPVERLGHGEGSDWDCFQSSLGLEGCEHAAMIDDAFGEEQLMLACGNVSQRLKWYPPIGRFSIVPSQQWRNDKVYKYNWKTRILTEIPLQGLSGDFVSHGFSCNLSLCAFLNHRREGSVLEIFEYNNFKSELQHVQSIRDPLVHTPNAIVVVSPDLIYFTNDHRYRTGILRELETKLARPWSDVVKVEIHRGTKNPSLEIVAENLIYANGIAASADLVLVAAALDGQVHVYKRNKHGGLEKRNMIPVDFVVDNIFSARNSIGHEFYLTGSPRPFEFEKQLYHPEHQSAIQVGRVSCDESGRECNCAIVIRDDGSLISGATTMVESRDKKKRFLVGVMARKTVECNHLRVEPIFHE